MAAHSCILFRDAFPWIAALGSFLAFAHSSNFSYLSVFLTSSAMILCPFLIYRSKSCQKNLIDTEATVTINKDALKEPSHLEKDALMSDKNLSPCQKPAINTFQGDDDTACMPVGGKKIQEKFQVSEKEDKIGRNYILSSSEALSDSESIDLSTNSEDSDNDWIFRENGGHSTQGSDGSISDEESLIEIALPTRYYVDPKKQEQQAWYGFQQKFSDCSMESHFRKQNWFEMLNEMNEEENLIEIDIGMGCIRSPTARFEIQA